MTDAEMFDAHQLEDLVAKATLVAWFDSQDIPPGMAIGTMSELIADIAEKFLTKEQRSKLADSLTLYLVTRLAPQCLRPKHLMRKSKRLG
jgi:hypothetical protein